MAKPPAFLFYPNDWVGGTMGMTFEEKGAYVELLILQFNRGHMTERMARQTVGQLWDNVKDKFRQTSDGRYYNARLELEKIKREKYVKSRNNNKLGKNQYNELEDGHITSHMENENEDVLSSNGKGGEGGKGFNTKPLPEHFNGLPETNIGKVIELVSITQRVTLTNEDVKTLWGVFKIQNLTGENYYSNEGKVYSHFLNWAKTQKFKDNAGKTGTTSEQRAKSNSKSAGAYQLLEQLKKENGHNQP